MPNKMGCMIADVAGLTLTPEDKEMLRHPAIGGIILFTRNYESQAQLSALCQDIRASRDFPLIIMVDQEGGRVQRFINDFTRLPHMALFGRIYEENPNLAITMAKNCGWLMAIELLASGVDLSLAPVLDLNKGISSVIGQRAFHAQSKIVITLATAFMHGMAEAGMAATGKHFPGHGSVTLDSHVAIPVDPRTYQQIETDDLIPFTGMIKAGIHAIMAAHIIFPQVDTVPVGYSRRWLNEILREKLGFTGTIMSDDLNMEGANISANYSDRVIAAREAGCDFTLLCNNRKGVIQVLDHLPATKHRVDMEKWRVLEGAYTLHAQPFKESNRWQETHDFLLKINNQITI